MPRKSIASLAVVPIVNVKPRLPVPPENLSAGQLAAWRLVIDNLPAGYLGAEAAPLLASYCRHVDRAAQIEAELAALRPGEDRFAELSRLVIAVSHHAAALGRALRLNPSTRMVPVVAAHQIKRHVHADDKPWPDTPAA